MRPLVPPAEKPKSKIKMPPRPRRQLPTITYKCSNCGATDVRLWRQSHIYVEDIRLLCRPCAEADQHAKEADLLIGKLVPAIPIPDATSFYGLEEGTYTVQFEKEALDRGLSAWMLFRDPLL